ncbi:ubiquitin-associated domain-containing protein 1 [Trichonephila clavipes]|nr:ubiquitin-associated domain-containing protein 1 [Trichonephila clavipes]
MFTSFPSTDDQNEKTSEETSLSTSSVQQTTTSILNTYPTLDPGFEKTDTEEFISITESTSTESPSSTVSSTSTYSTIYPDTEKTSSGDLEISTIVTSNEDHSTTSNEITYSTLDPGSEKTNSEDTEVSTEMSSESTPTEVQWTSLATRESTSISPSTTSQPSSTQATDDPFSTLDPGSEKTNSEDIEVSTEMSSESTPTEVQWTSLATRESTSISPSTTSQPSSTQTTDDLFSTLDPGSEKTNSEDIEVSTEMSSESTPTEVQWTSLATRESTSISPPTTSLPSSTHATDDPISKEDREFPITESTVYETTISSTYSTTTELSTTAAITDEVTSTQQVTTIETKIPEITSTIGETTTPDVESNFMCPEPNGYFPHPTDKHKFVGCTNNIPAVLTCPVMYVVNTSLGSIETMKITVINSTGAYWVVDVLPEFTIDKLKLMALSHFFNPIDSIKVSDRYKLILVSQNRPLPDESTIRDEEIRENDELLLLKRRQLLVPIGESQEEKEEKCRGPTENEIQKETSGIHPKNLDAVVENPSVPVDFHTELRKILVSLVKVSEKLLRYHPEVVALFKEMAEGEEVKEEEPFVDKTSLKQLTDMGFPESQAIEALKQNSNVSDAMDWLLAHSVDTNSSTTATAAKTNSSPVHIRKFSVPKFSVSKLVDKCTSDKSSASEKVTASTSQKQDTEIPSTSQGTGSNVEQARIIEMIRCFRAYKRKVFRPSSAVSHLKHLLEIRFASCLFNNMTSETVEVARIALRLPPFWKSNVRLWIAQCDHAFTFSGISSDDTKCSALVANLDAETLSYVSDIVLSPPNSDKYHTLLQWLITQFSDSDTQKIKKLLTDLQLGDEKPSHLLRKMKELSNGQLQDDFLQSLWLQRMPPHIQTVLSASSEPLINWLSLLIRFLRLLVRPSTICAATTVPPPSQSSSCSV